MKFCIIIVVLLSATLLKAQHGISPGYAFINEQNRQVTITIFNHSDAEKEANVSFNFGYPYYDSLGSLQMMYNDTITAAEYGIDDKVRIFPRKVILPGRSQQTVRFVFAGNFDNLPDGTLWTRIKVVTLVKKQQIETPSDSGNVSVGVDIEYETNTILMIQKGKLSSEIDLGDVEIKQDSAYHYFLIDTKKLGNSPYIGMFEMNIQNEANDNFEAERSSYVVYFDSKPSIRMPKKDLPPGNYTATLKVHNDRPDLDKKFRIPLDDYIKKFYFRIENNGEELIGYINGK